MKKKVTIKEIARELDVSVSTVSKALRNRKEIGAETTQRIQAFAKLLNYKPNSIAISLKNKRSRNIGVIIPEIVHHFFTTVISGIETAANNLGYNVIVCLSNESFDKEVINMETLAGSSIDGFILSLTKETQKKKDFHHLLEVIDQGMPVVMFDRVTEEINCDKIVVDDAYAVYNATNHLILSGCKRIALLTTMDYVSVGKQRTMGYLNALNDAGIQVDENIIVRIENIEHCENQISSLFEDQKFDAVLSVNEVFAVTAMRQALNRGLKIPEDVSFIGFTNGLLSKYFYPRLTTIVQHGYKMGEKAAKILIERLEDEEEEEKPFIKEVIKTSLRERESTKSI
ncbi:LacI family DNA-binding transcriptional regulator [uncultured Maribacter sp.]|uniref:LacI family DNA-binding transcriptional regulator n=1 Tax=uncultured Maribacter sp. TaxID=431308 RepID=UPI00263046D7|nr:LacI family DNA-binding transcriptional regulator [uncultured Maribacter sp.]